jgi:hypothetical protein
LSNAALKPIADGLQQRVSRAMSQRIIDELKAVEIYLKHGESCAVTLRPSQALLQSIVQKQAVREAGQQIVMSLKQQPVMKLPLLDSQRGKLAGHVDQLQFGRGGVTDVSMAHGEGAQDAPGGPDDRRRPACLQSLPECRISERTPKWICFFGADDASPWECNAIFGAFCTQVSHDAISCLHNSLGQTRGQVGKPGFPELQDGHDQPWRLALHHVY